MTLTDLYIKKQKRFEPNSTARQMKCLQAKSSNSFEIYNLYNKEIHRMFKNFFNIRQKVLYIDNMPIIVRSPIKKKKLSILLQEHSAEAYANYINLADYPTTKNPYDWLEVSNKIIQYIQDFKSLIHKEAAGSFNKIVPVQLANLIMSEAIEKITDTASFVDTMEAYISYYYTLDENLLYNRILTDFFDKSLASDFVFCTRQKFIEKYKKSTSTNEKDVIPNIKDILFEVFKEKNITPPNMESTELNLCVEKLIKTIISSIKNIKSKRNKNDCIVNKTPYHTFDFSIFVLFNLYVIAQSHVKGPIAHDFLELASKHLKAYFLNEKLDIDLIKKIYSTRISKYNDFMIKYNSLEKANKSLLFALYQFLLKDNHQDYLYNGLLVTNSLDEMSTYIDITYFYKIVSVYTNNQFLHTMQLYKQKEKDEN